MQVSALDVVALGTGKRWQGRATATVIDIDGGNAPVADATVVGDWSFQEAGGGPPIALGSASGTTGADGLAVVQSSKRKAQPGDSFTFLITDVIRSGSVYDLSGVSSGTGTVP
jgi:hypothetical protein